MIDDRKSSHGGSEDGTEATSAIDFAFLRRQTFDDRELEREVLQLFIEQARRVVPSLPGLSASAQADAAHLLKGSALGVGAFAAAALAEAYEADVAGRETAYSGLVAAFERAQSAILAHIAGKP